MAEMNFTILWNRNFSLLHDTKTKIIKEMKRENEIFSKNFKSSNYLSKNVILGFFR